MSLEYDRPCEKEKKKEDDVKPKIEFPPIQFPKLPTPPSTKEVFHISDQIYTFDEAKCKCASYGATLATENQMKQAYNEGAHWCTYGWTDGQKAFYPVQSALWKKDKS